MYPKFSIFPRESANNLLPSVVDLAPASFNFEDSGLIEETFEDGGVELGNPIRLFSFVPDVVDDETL